MAAIALFEDIEMGLDALEAMEALVELFADDAESFADAAAAVVDEIEAAVPEQAIDAVVAEQQAAAAADEAASAANPDTWAKITKIAKQLYDFSMKLGALIGMIVGLVKLLKGEVGAKPPLLEDSKIRELMVDLSTASTTARDTLNEWGDWIQSNFDSRNTFGTSTIDGLEIETFLLFHAQCSTLTFDMHRNITDPIQNLWNTRFNLTTEKVLDAYPSMVQICQQMSIICHDIDANYQLMTKAGLKSHTADLTQATNLLAQHLRPGKLSIAQDPTSAEALCERLHRPETVPKYMTTWRSIWALADQADSQNNGPLLQKYNGCDSCYSFGLGSYSVMADWLNNNFANAAKYGEISPDLLTFFAVQEWVNTQIDDFATEMASFNDLLQLDKSGDQNNAGIDGIVQKIVGRRIMTEKMLSQPMFKQICADGLCVSFDSGLHSQLLGAYFFWIDLIGKTPEYWPAADQIVSSRRRALAMKESVKGRSYQPDLVQKAAI